MCSARPGGRTYHLVLRSLPLETSVAVVLVAAAVRDWGPEDLMISHTGVRVA